MQSHMCSYPWKCVDVCVWLRTVENLLFVKVKIEGKFHSNRPRTPKGGVEVEHYSFFNLGARCEWVVKATLRPLYPGKDPVPIV
jgi:hypothetical protein